MDIQAHTSEIFQLHALPTEILACIFNLPSHSHSVIKLWKCGDRLLQSRLEKCMTSLRLRSALGWECFVPPLVSKLIHLRHLALYSEFDLMFNPNHWVLFFNSLPGTLESIRIASADSSLALLNIDPQTKSPLDTLYERGSSTFIDLGRLFPRLETLAVLPPESTLRYAYKPTIANHNLAGLPPTLTSLTAILELNFRSMPLLPLSLRHLLGNVTLSETDSEGFDPARPYRIPDIEYIDFMYTELSAYPRWLPRTVTNCGSIFFKWTPDVPPTWPSSLTKLVLVVQSDDRPTSLGEWLPPLLTDLSIWFLPSSFSIADLPRTLKRLYVQYIEKDEWSDIRGQHPVESNTWPPHLEELSTRLHLDVTLLDVIPQTLTSLELSLSLQVDLDARKLPPKLKRLTLSNPLLGITRIQHQLPSDLRFLSLGSLTSDFVTLAAGSFDSLPSSLEELCMAHVQRLLSRPNTFLVHKLTTLECFQWRCEWFDLIPRSVTRFSAHLTEETDSSLKVIEGKFFEGLPPRLLHLSVYDDFSFAERHWPLQRLASILPELQDLQMSNTGTMPASFIRELPQSLLTAKIPLDEFEPREFPFLPPLATCIIMERVMPWPAHLHAVRPPRESIFLPTKLEKMRMERRHRLNPSS